MEIKRGYRGDVVWSIQEVGAKSFVMLSHTNNQSTIKAKIKRVGKGWAGHWWRGDSKKRQPLKGRSFNEVLTRFKPLVNSNNPRTRQMIKDIRTNRSLHDLFKDNIKKRRK